MESPPGRQTRSAIPTAVVAVVFALTGLSTVAGRPLGKQRAAESPGAGFDKEIKPLLGRYCYGCHNDEKHKGGLSLQAYPDAGAVRRQREVWAGVLQKLRAGEMPPEGKPHPSQNQRDRVAAWIEAELFPVDCDHPDPGRVTLRRLNRTEYRYTIRDLVGVDFLADEGFPDDDTGYGFDNIGDVLSMSPLLLEKYLAAADKVLDAAVADGNFRSRILICQPTEATTNQGVRAILANFARRAFRRPATGEEIARLSRLAEQAQQDGGNFEQGIRVAAAAVLVSPHFLFRGELQPEPDNPRVTRPIDEFALASRLSYFLWSSMPDDELAGLAEKGKLRKNLEAQVRRMLRDPKSQALVENFAGQWLQLRNLKLVTPDPGSFPAFDEDLRAAMQKETELFVGNMMLQDRSVLEFLTADYTFVNERLARHYGLPAVAGSGFQRVSLKGTARGGVLTHASVLTIVSNPTRTSPVKRGKWVLDNLLAQPPPPPPPGVPPLSESKEDAASATLRERMERHRQDPLCASCHAQMDPIGFALENFDAIGAWRNKDGAFAIDPSGRLPSGEKFAGATELRKILASQRRDQFARCLAEKMLTYALGRGLEFYDRCAVDRITAELARQNFRFSALVLGVAKSVPFQMRRGEGDPISQGAN